MELAAAVLLGAAALLTAVSAYFSAIRGGEAQDAYTRASIARVEAAKARGSGDQLRAFEYTLFIQYGQALATGNKDLERFIRVDLGAQPVVDAIEWWRGQNPKPASPFAAGNPLNENPFYARADQVEATSQADYAAAVRAGAAGDRYTLATVLFAVVLFASGVAGQFRRKAIRKGTLAVAGAFLVAGVGYLMVAGG